MSSEPSSSRVNRRRARARARIIASTAELVRRDGIPGLTMEAVAEAADVSKPSLYYYFASKEELVRGLAIERSADAVAVLMEAMDATPADGSVPAAVLRAYVKYHLASLHLFRAEYVWPQVIGIDSEQVDQSVNPGMNAFFDSFQARLETSRAQGRLRPEVNPRRTALATYMTAHGIVSVLSVLDAGGTGFRHQVSDIVEESCGLLTRATYLDA